MRKLPLDLLKNSNIIDFHGLRKNCRLVWVARPVPSYCHIHDKKEILIKWISKSLCRYIVDLMEECLIYIPLDRVPLP